MNNRRNFLKLAGISSMSTLVTLKGASALDNCDFKPTPRQPEGPFYPLQLPLDSDTDLTRVKGRTLPARGEVVIVEGVVTDDYCRPIPGAIVEIWQACHSGRYNHPSDTSGTELDENFQYYGVMKTNEKGGYSFKTIKPGSYLASEDWRRPPHIHYKVSLRGYHELITQLYFEGNEFNEGDEILRRLNREDQKKVIVKFEGLVVPRGRFDITLRKI